MAAFALSAFALAASAGCAGPTELSASPMGAQAATVATAQPRASAALQMALATEQAQLGPTPTLAAQLPPGEAPLHGYTLSATGVESSRPVSFNMGVSQTRSFGPSAGLAAMPGSGEWRPLELTVAGGGEDDGLGFLMARRAGSQEGPGGAATTTGAELRIGQRLRAMTHEFRSPTSWKHPAWYVFAASDGEALIYTPTADPFSPNRNFTTQDRVTVGSMQAGLSMEAHGMQASLAYVKRKVTTIDLIRHEETHDEDFAGFTFTWRR